MCADEGMKLANMTTSVVRWTKGKKYTNAHDIAYINSLVLFVYCLCFMVICLQEPLFGYMLCSYRGTYLKAFHYRNKLEVMNSIITKFYMI